MNRTQLMGHIGTISAMTTIGNGIEVVNFSLATNEKWKDKDGNEQESTEWHNCSAFGNTAKYINTYIQVGDLCYVEGKLKTSKVDATGTDEKPHYYTTIRVKDMKFLRRKNEQSAGAASEELPPEFADDGKDKDIPF